MFGGLLYRSPFTKNEVDAILNGATAPTAANPFVTVSYVQSYIQGFNQKPNAFWATTAALAGTWTYDNTAKTLTRTTNGALPAQDGITPALSDIGLIKNQVSQLTNGLYTVTQLGTAGTPTILTRQINMDVSAEFNGATIAVNQGTTNSGAIFLFNYVSGFVMGTNNVAFTQINSVAGLLKADGTVPLTASWAAGNFTITANSVQLGSAANTITGLATIINGAGTLTLPTTTGTLALTTIVSGYLKADGSIPLTAAWSAGAFTITANSVQIGSAANTITGLSTIINGAATLTLPSTTGTVALTTIVNGYLKADGSIPLTADWAAGAFKISGGTSVINFTTNRLGVGTTSPANTFVASNLGALGLEIDPTSSAGTRTGILNYDRNVGAYRPLDFTASAFYFDGGNIGLGSSATSYAGFAGKVLSITSSGANGVEMARTGASDGDNIGGFVYCLPDNTTNKGGAAIFGFAEGAHATNKGAKLVFYTKANNATYAQSLEIAGSGAATFVSTIKTGAPSGGTASTNLWGQVGTIGGTLATALGVAGLGAINRFQQKTVDGTLFYILGSSTSPA